MLKHNIVSLGHAKTSGAKTSSAWSLYHKRRYRENFLYLIRCGIVESVPSRRILSCS
jgi:hypothetical protein